MAGVRSASPVASDPVTSTHCTRASAASAGYPLGQLGVAGSQPGADVADPDPPPARRRDVRRAPAGGQREAAVHGGLGWGRVEVPVAEAADGVGDQRADGGRVFGRDGPAVGEELVELDEAPEPSYDPPVQGRQPAHDARSHDTGTDPFRHRRTGVLQHRGMAWSQHQRLLQRAGSYWPRVLAPARRCAPLADVQPPRPPHAGPDSGAPR